ncbi:hypothetical protein JD844_014949 [Phrynosoma platyrhinos]|uniref:RRM domain-containing protein n=1 Tax=Phrynosoma platyrhinos TaxID=52577 RepID=A0ABQ7T705_PHRPL|nr:hypothetical protein JD844_014949 [Phrynosoma platyrhinos]
MSRLIVKNLPSGMREDRFRNLFAAFGTLTDCALKFTKDGKFRKFGFIGFKSEDDAKAALTHLNKSFIDTTRVTVEFCKSFGDPLKPRAWSKHSQKPPAVKKLPEKSAKSSGPTKAKQDKKKKENQAELKELEGEEAFQDFLVVHKKRSQTATWSNDTKVKEPKKSQAKPMDDYLNFDSDESESLSEEEAEFGDGERKAGITREEDKSAKGKAAARPDLSDMDYLRSKVVKDVESSSSSEEDSDEEIDNKEPSEEEEEEAKPSPEQNTGSGFTAESEVGENNKGQKSVVEIKKLKATTQGRMLHVLPSTIKKEEGESGEAAEASSYKKQKASKDKASSSSSHNWNTLFMGVNAVADAVAQKYNATKSQVLDHAAGERSKTVILVKNLPAGTEAAELEEVFGTYGSLGRVLLPEGGVTAIVEFLEPTEAKRAFTKLAYSKFRHIPLYLEWAPMGVFSGPGKGKLENSGDNKEDEGKAQTGSSEKEEAEMEAGKAIKEEENEDDDDDDDESIPGCTLFIKNLNFSTTEETLKEVFAKVGAVKNCTVSKKRDKTAPLYSNAFGIAHLPLSRWTRSPVASARKKQTSKKQRSSKILVRNIPFQATVREIRELFRKAS